MTMGTSQRTSEVMKKIAPGLDEDSRREKKSSNSKVFKFDKREKTEKKWLSYWYADIIQLGLALTQGTTS